MPQNEAAQFWEAKYADTSRVWTGRPNQAVVAEVSDLPVGSVLDLGCGEGGDAIWLAGRGWQVTAVDISPTALARAEVAAAQAGIPEPRIRWVAHDLASWSGDGSYDLVTSCFMHSPLEFPRAAVLRHAASLVAPGGHLLIVAHATLPPWADGPDRRERQFLTPHEEIDSLGLPSAEWETRIAETRPRQATGPDGSSAVVDDAVVLLHRR